MQSDRWHNQIQLLFLSSLLVLLFRLSALDRVVLLRVNRISFFITPRSIWINCWLIFRSNPISFTDHVGLF